MLQLLEGTSKLLCHRHRSATLRQSALFPFEFNASNRVLRADTGGTTETSIVVEQVSAGEACHGDTSPAAK
jgi:hypothetical protein